MTQTDKTQKDKLRVLIADDIHETRRNTRLMIAAMDNVEVIAIASNGKQAVEMAREQRPDIVILDINMPEMDGLTAFKYIIRSHPNTGCIIISGESNPKVMALAASIGIKEYLTKPFTIDELETAIKHVQTQLKETRPKFVQSNLANINDLAHLEQIAHDYLKEGRTDDQALQIFERLAQNPQCAIRWLETLAMIYAIRREWGKVKFLAARLEKETNNKK